MGIQRYVRHNLVRGAATAACVLLPTASAPSLPREAPVVVLYQEGQSEYALHCPPGLCRAQAVAAVTCREPHARTVVVAGHSAPPMYLGASAKTLARAVHCFTPELVVLDTCFGASSPLLHQLAAAGPGPAPIVVGATYRVQRGGLRYLPAFFSEAEKGAEESSLARQAAAVQTWSGAPLLRWRPDQQRIASLQAEVQMLSDNERTRRSRVRFAPLIPMQAIPGQDILVLDSRLREERMPAEEGSRATRAE